MSEPQRYRPTPLFLAARKRARVFPQGCGGVFQWGSQSCRTLGSLCSTEISVCNGSERLLRLLQGTAASSRAHQNDLCVGWWLFLPLHTGAGTVTLNFF